MARFIHLHTHSHYSLLAALPKIPDLIEAAKADGAPALALTDNGNLYGAIEFYKDCKKAGIKPIIGADFYVAARARTDKQSGIDSRRTRLILLAKNLAGYHNLIKLVTESFLTGFYYKPRIDRELIEKYHDGLIAISSAFTGDLTLALQGNDMAKACEIAGWYKNIFGSDYYLEITHHPDIEGHETLMERTEEVARRTNVPLCAGGNVYYIRPEDKPAQQTLMLVNSSGDDKISDDDTADFSFISNETAQNYFRDTPEAIINTEKIADKCNLLLPLGKWIFPKYTVTPGKSYDEELREIVFAGFEKRKMEKTKEAIDRVEYELKVIKDKGYAPYFLIVSDLMRYAHENGILTTIRGSVAGSLVTYLAGVTTIDPLEYKLPFERFLNPERPSAPDIDMDFADDRRDEMIEYTKKKYGRENVAQISTFGTMAARGSVRDVTRALGFPVATGDKLAKLIPMGSQGFPMTINRALELVPELKAIYDGDADTKRIVDLAKKIEGCARQISTHAAGVVIAPTNLTDYTPLQYDPRGENKIITQYDMYSITDEYGGIGLLKFDFLGIKNLAILASAVNLVKKIENKTVDIENIPVDDKKTFEMLARGETEGLFQLNGSGMTKHLKDLKPSTIHDINAMVALYRPGPMESIPQYIERKHDPSKVEFLDPRLTDILDRSYGVLTYQDDVMMIAIKLGGYTWPEADKLRKAMGKKIPKEMEEQKEKLLAGLVKNGMTQTKAKKMWSLIEPFAAYGFNKAHAASYGRVAYQTAYMKANFPAIYMSAVLTADSGEVEKIGEIITECKRMGIPVLPPSVNESFEGFTVIKGESGTAHTRGDKIRFGLSSIKNFGEGISKAIIDERKVRGKFRSLSDFLGRIKDKNLNKKSLEALIKAGALDEFADRTAMYGNIERLLEYNKEKVRNGGNQDSLFAGVGTNGDANSNEIEELRLDTVAPVTVAEKLLWEKELLGLYISGHPLDKYKSILEKRPLDIAKVKTKANLEISLGKTLSQETFVLGGIIEEVRPVTTKKNDSMCFLRLADMSGTIEAVVFPRTYAQFKSVIVPEKCIAIKAKLSERNGEISLVAESFMALA
ncbi:MAG: DNA polymerase III subunit alpha [Patescibacteria group bacterium]